MHTCKVYGLLCLVIFTCLPSSCVHSNSKPDPVYEDPQLEANPAYGVAGMAMVVNEEEIYETCLQ